MPLCPKLYLSWCRVLLEVHAPWTRGAGGVCRPVCSGRLFWLWTERGLLLQWWRGGGKGMLVAQLVTPLLKAYYQHFAFVVVGRSVGVHCMWTGSAVGWVD